MKVFNSNLFVARGVFLEQDAPLTGCNSMCCLQPFAFISFHQVFVLYFFVCLFGVVVGAQLQVQFNVSCGDAFVYIVSLLGPGEFKCINETVSMFILHGRVSTMFIFAISRQMFYNSNDIG